MNELKAIHIFLIALIFVVLLEWAWIVVSNAGCNVDRYRFETGQTTTLNGRCK